MTADTNKKKHCSSPFHWYNFRCCKTKTAHFEQNSQN